MKRLHYTLMLMVAASFVACWGAHASGSYNNRPPRVPKGETRHQVDAAKYALGKKVYTGKVKLSTTASVDRAAQEKRLRELELRLPERARRDANLPAMAGKISTEQLEALEYYVTNRYPNK